MALIIDVSIQLSVQHRPTSAEARFWVDSKSESGLNTELELPLTRRAGNTWIGTLALEDTAAQFLYRLGLLAHPGAVWALTIRNRSQGVTLLSDTDELGAGKAWMTGLCPLTRGESAARQCVGAGAQPAPLPRRHRNTPYLLLLDR